MSTKGFGCVRVALMVASLATLIAGARPAQPDVVVRSQFFQSIMLMGAVSGTSTVSTRSDRSVSVIMGNVVRDDSSTGTPHHTRTIMRLDKGLQWTIDFSDSTYAEDPLSALRELDSLQVILNRLDARGTTTIREPPGEQTLQGIPAQHFLIEQTIPGDSMSRSMDRLFDLWLGFGTPAILELWSFENAKRIATTTNRTVDDSMSVEFRLQRVLSEKRGIPLRNRMVWKMDLTDFGADTLSRIVRIDRKLGGLVIADEEVLSIETRATENALYELPPGLRPKPSQVRSGIESAREMIQYLRDSRR